MARVMLWRSRAVMPARWEPLIQPWLGPQTLVARMISSRRLVFIQRPTISSVRPAQDSCGGTG